MLSVSPVPSPVDHCHQECGHLVTWLPGYLITYPLLSREPCTEVLCCQAHIKNCELLRTITALWRARGRLSVLVTMCACV